MFTARRLLAPVQVFGGGELRPMFLGNDHQGACFMTDGIRKPAGEMIIIDCLVFVLDRDTPTVHGPVIVTP